MKIIGEGVITKGNYQDLKVIGSARAEEGFNADNLKVVGEITSKDVINSLSGKIIGSITCNEINIDNCKLIGEFIGDKVTSKNLSLIGEINSKVINTNEIKVKTGNLNVNEISADLIDIKNTTGNVESIVGEKIKVYKKFTLTNRRQYKQVLNVDEIEGDYVYLEKVNAKKVSGKVVEIGPNCVIDVLESENKSIHKSSVVKEGGLNE